MTANALTFKTLTPSGILVPSLPSIWYPMHEPVGSAATTLVEAFGLGPTLTLQGTTPANGWANAGFYTPNGTDHDARGAASAHLDTVMGLNTLAAGGMVVYGFSFQYTGTHSTDGCFFYYGRDSGSTGTGGWGQACGGTGLGSLRLRSIGLASVSLSGYGNWGLTHPSMVQVLLGLSIPTPGFLRVESRISSDPGAIGENQQDLSALTGGLVSTAADGLTLMARRTSAAGSTSLLGNGGDGARMNNFFCQKRPAYDPVVLGEAFNDLMSSPREFPKRLRSA